MPDREHVNQAQAFINLPQQQPQLKGWAGGVNAVLRVMGNQLVLFKNECLPLHQAQHLRSRGRHGPRQEHSGNLARRLTGGHGSLPWTGVRGRKMTSSPFTKHPTRSASSITRQTGSTRLGREAVTSLTLIPMRGLRLGVLAKSANSSVNIAENLP